VSARRVLGFFIAAVLAGAVAAAFVKSDEEPLAAPTDLPTQTVSETPTDFETPTPSFPPTSTPTATAAGETPSGQTTDTTEPTATMSELPRTGDGSFAGPASLSLVLAAAAGWAVRRTLRRPLA
jgi:hypothetical protein